MLLRKTPLSKRLTTEEIDKRLKNVVCMKYNIMILIYYVNNIILF